MWKSIFSLILASTLFTPSAEAVSGVLQKYISDEELFEISNTPESRIPQLQGTAVRFDTRDAIRCMRLKDIIRRNNAKISNSDLDDLCKVNRDHPFKDIVVLQTDENQELLNFIKSGLNIGVASYESNKSKKVQSEYTSSKNQEFMLTPLFAVMVSESIAHLRNYVQTNGGKAANSKVLGSTILIVTNPAESIAEMVNGFYKYPFIQEAKTKVLLRDYRDEDGYRNRGRSPEMNALEFKLEFRYK